jgi:hypothetical protein
MEHNLNTLLVIIVDSLIFKPISLQFYSGKINYDNSTLLWIRGLNNWQWFGELTALTAINNDMNNL